jgi:hypothetical protein
VELLLAKGADVHAKNNVRVSRWRFFVVDRVLCPFVLEPARWLRLILS